MRVAGWPIAPGVPPHVPPARFPPLGAFGRRPSARAAASLIGPASQALTSTGAAASGDALIFRVAVAQPSLRPNLMFGFDGVLPYDLDSLVAQRVQIFKSWRVAVCHRLVKAIKLGDANIPGGIAHECDNLSASGS